MRNAILYAGTIVAVVQIFYLAQLAAAAADITRTRPSPAFGAAARPTAAPPRPVPHAEPAHMRSRTFAARDALLRRTGVRLSHQRYQQRRHRRRARPRRGLRETYPRQIRAHPAQEGQK